MKLILKQVLQLLMALVALYGVLLAATPTNNLGDNTAAQEVAQAFIVAISKHRHWDRVNVDAVAA